MNSNRVLDFYSAQTRFWELLIGSMLAILNIRSTRLLSAKYKNLFSIAGLALIGISLFFIDNTDPYPGTLALLPTLGAALFIYSGANSISNKLLSHKHLVKIGLISFPLYLWHWPLLVFGRILYGGKPSAVVITAIILTSLVLSFITYYFFERPLKDYSNKGNLTIALSASICILFLVGAITFNQNGLAFRSILQKYENLPKTHQELIITKNISPDNHEKNISIENENNVLIKK